MSLFSVLFLLIFPHRVVAADSTYIEILADNSYPPHSYSAAGKAAGLYADIVNAVLSRMPDYQVKIIPIPWKRGLELIKAGEYLAIYPPYYHVRKRPYMWPYSLPLFDEKVIVLCRWGIDVNQPKANWPDDYHFLRFGLNAGFYLGGNKFHQAVSDKNITLESLGGNEQNLQKLIRGRTDCYLNDELSIVNTLKQMLKDKEITQEQRNRLKKGPVISQESGFLGYSRKYLLKHREKEQFIVEFNIQLYELKRTGQLQNITEEHLNPPTN